MSGFELLKGFADERGLGKPTRILTCGEGEPFAFVHGVGAEWIVDGQEPIRNAVRCSFAELPDIKRSLEEWKAA